MGRPKQWEQVLKLGARGEQRGNTGVAELPGDAPALSWQPDTSALTRGISCRMLTLFVRLTSPLCSKNSTVIKVPLFGGFLPQRSAHSVMWQ